MVVNILLFLFVNFVFSEQKTQKPNILFIVADDLGWNDVSWHNEDILTPNLHQLAKDGVILNQSYVQPMCTPSRAAFMTGYYPFRVGLQYYVFRPLDGSGLPLNLTTLPQVLSTQGYHTHLVGKWHLGFCNWKYTPTFRGFNTFFGYYNGESTHYTHVTDKFSTPDDTYSGFDLRDNLKSAWSYNGTYSTHAFTDAAIKIINNESTDQPFFLYLAYQAPHAPLEVPKQYSDLYKHIENIERRNFSGMVTALDEGVGKVVQALKAKGFYDNTLIVFTSDNGGNVLFGGNNWPLRGNKDTVWEGGTRGAAFVHGSMLQKKGYISNKLIHAVDWYPTLISLAGGVTDSGIDGVNQWSMLSEDKPSNRYEFVYNIDNTTDYVGAIRFDDYKLIVGNAGEISGRIPLFKSIDSNSEKLKIFKNMTEPPVKLPRLYDIKSDPLEKHNLASKERAVTSYLLHRLYAYEKLMVPSIHLPNDQRGNPIYWNNTFSPGWCEPDSLKSACAASAAPAAISSMSRQLLYFICICHILISMCGTRISVPHIDFCVPQRDL